MSRKLRATRWRILLPLIAIISIFLFAVGSVSAATMVVVNQIPSDWSSGVETGTGTLELVDGPGTPPLGMGSAQFVLDSTSSGVILGTAIYPGTRLNEFTTLEYSTYNSVGNNTVAPALQFNIDYDLTDSTTSWQGRLVFEPYYDNVIVDGTWQTWDALAGRWWSTGNPVVGDAAATKHCPISSPCDIATLLTHYPDAGIQTGSLSGLLFKAGSGWLAGYTGSVDAFTIGINGTDTIYDFELLSCSGEANCYVDAATGSDSNSGLLGDPLATIQEGIDRVGAGGTVHVAASTYTESLDINKALTLSGAGQSDVTIDASSINDYSIEITASDVTVEGFTLNGNSSGSAAYGLKIAGPSPTRISNIIVQDVTVDSSRRTGVDLNGVDGATITGVTVSNVPSGNGFALTDSNDVVASGLTTNNNAWGGFAIYTFGRYFSLGSNNINITGVNNFGEDNKVYVQRGNFNNPGSPQEVTNLTVDGFEYTVMNDTFRAGGENFTFYQITQADAITFALGLATPADSYVNEIANGHFWVGQDVSTTMTIQIAISKAVDGDTINVLDGTYPEVGQLVIDKDLTIVGESQAGTIVQPTADTGSSNDARGWWLVEAGNTLDLSMMTLDGNDFLIWQAIRHLGAGSVDQVTFTDIRYNESTNYAGTAVAIFGSTPVNVANSAFSNIGRIGVQFFGSGASGSVYDNNTYVGKGAGDWLDYGVEVGAGAQVTIQNSAISNNLGVASSDGSTSAGILVSTFFGAGSEATITGNVISGNTTAIAVGFDSSDTSVVNATMNDITDNDFGVNSTQPQVNATVNWWGDPSGPSGQGPGTGDSVSTNVTFCPWLDDSISGAPVASGGATAQNINTGEYFCSIQEAINDSDTVDGHTIEVEAGTFNEQVEVTKNIDLVGAGSNDTFLVSTATCTNQMNSSATAGIRLVGDHSGISISGFNISGYDLGLDIGENIGRTISDVSISDVNASNNCVHGVLSQAGDTDGVTISNSTFNDNGSGFSAGRGLWFINGTKANISIINSTFNDNRLVGIDISDGDVTDLTISDNTVIGNGDSGIGVLGPQGPDANLVSGNTVTDNGRYGIEIKNPSGTTTVSGNIVSLTGPGSDTRDYAGIAVFRRGPGATNADQPSGVTVTGNTVTGFVEPNGDGEGFGIVVEGSGITVTDNTVTNNDVGIQVQEGNPTPNTNATDYFDRGDASVVADATVNNNDIAGNIVGVRAVGTTNITDATVNWWGDATGPSGEGTGTGDSVSVNVAFCPWLDDSISGSPSFVSTGGGIATTSTDGHTTPYCTIEEAMFASSGASQEVHVTEGDWAGEVMTRDYSDSPDLLVIATGNRDNTIVNGMYLTGSSFAGLTFDNFTITGDAPTSSGYDPGYAVEITNSGNYADLAFVNNIFDGANVEDAAAIFSNRGWDGFLLDNNRFVNYNESPLTPLTDGYYANFSLVFMEAQVYTPAGRGNNYVATNNTFEGITHLNALEAFRWQNVTMSGNDITGTFGRLLVWSYNTDPLVSVNISGNTLALSAGTDTATSTGIGVYYADADVNITGNTVDGANTCLNTNGVTDLEVTGNNLNNCETRGHLYSDSDFDADGGDAPYVAPVSAVIQGNTFNTSPVGVENAAQVFELDVCDNTFINIVDLEFENPGPFAPCTFDVTIIKDATPDAEELDFSFELYNDDTQGIEDNFTLDGSNDGSGNVAVFNLLEGNYTISETNLPQDWELVDLTCNVDGVEVDGNSVSIALERGGDDVICTFSNSEILPLTVYKFYDTNENGEQDESEDFLAGWEFIVSDSQNNEVTSGVTDENGMVSFELPVGDYTVCETLQSGWTNTTPLCQEITVGDEAAAEEATLIFGNVDITGSITIIKNEVPDGDQNFLFEIRNDDGLLASPIVSDGNPITTSDLLPGSYDVTEVFAGFGSGYVFGGAVCDNGVTLPADPSGNNTTVSLDLAAGEHITCTFTNQQLVSLVIYKETIPDGDSTEFTFTQDFRPDLGETFTLTDGSFQQYVEGLPGTYTVTEDLPENWVLNDVTCDGGEVNTLEDGIEITLDYGDSVTCTFTNQFVPPTSSITIIKNVIYDADIDIDSDRDFFFFSEGLSDFILDDPLVDDADGISNSQVFSNVAPGEYTITENPNGNWTQSVVCVGDDNIDYVAPGTGAIIDLDAGENVTCTFTNERDTYTLTYEKVLAEGTDAPDSDWVFTLADANGANAINTLYNPFTTIASIGGFSTTYTLPADDYRVGEIVPEGYDLLSINCGAGGQVTDPSNDDFYIQLFSDQTCTFTNAEETTDVTIVKSIDWNGNDVNNAVTFDICLTGEGEQFCGTVSPLGLVLNFSDVPLGDYTLSEAPAIGWTVGYPDGQNVEVTADGENEFRVHNTQDAPPPPPEEQVGTITVIKRVVNAPAEYANFTICIVNPIFPEDQQNQATCYEVHDDGNQVSWNVVIPQGEDNATYNVFEVTPLPENWSAQGASANVNVTPNNTSYHTVTNTYAPPPPPTCNGGIGPQSHLSGYITISGLTATGHVTNNSNVEGCVYPVGLASYEKYDEEINNQIMFASNLQSPTIAPGQTYTFTVRLPECATQVDLFYGHDIPNFAAGERFGSRLFDAVHLPGNGYCVADQPPVEEQPPAEELPVEELPSEEPVDDTPAEQPPAEDESNE